MENPSFVLRNIKDVVIEDRPKPILKDPHDVMVHVAQTGICGSDVHYWQRGRIGDFVLTGPMVLGHESAGVVVEVGDKVRHLKPGDRVAMEPGVPCRRCDYCRSGSYNLCGDTIFAATPPWDGTLAKYYAVAKAAGARTIIGVDVIPYRLEVAKSYGIDHTFMPSRAEPGTDPMVHAERVATQLKEELGLGEGVDMVLECSGAEPCVQMGIYAARRGATFVQAGMGKENILFPITAVCTRGLTIKGSIRYLTGCYPAAIDLIAKGKIDVKRLITNRFPFEKAEEAFELVKAGREDVFKVMIAGVQE
ncbi:Arylsulfotransferase (ASST) family protein [Aspergillus niger]|uniref:D-xylulose reductase n=1 Tax=Aspergillus niger TaxID=5061 RepID=A0A505HXC3_ASPNG|nr:Arylsulfotransferase (ASST) family protein [Aspergillus niger]